MVTAFGIGQEAPVTLEVAVSLVLVWGLGVEVDSLVSELSPSQAVVELL